MKIDIDKARYFAEIGGFKNDSINIGMIVKSLRRLSNQHRRICEMECNGYGFYLGIDFGNINWDDENNKADKIRNNIELKIIDIVKLINPDFLVDFQYDPRGDTVEISWENIVQT